MGKQRVANHDEDVAIIGMACMFPEAPDLDTFWRNILGKVDGVGEPTEDWGAERYYVPDSNSDEYLYTKAGGFLRDLYRFNPAEFGIMPSSVDGQEPDHFLALKIARDALADAGYFDADYDHTNTGIVLGHSTYLHRGQTTVIQRSLVVQQTLDIFEKLYPDLDSEELDRIKQLIADKLPPFTADTAPGLVPNVMTGRVANRLNLMGPNYLIDAACASSLLAVNAALGELRSGRSDLMLAGGVNASIPAEACKVFSHLGGLSRSSRIRPFDANADGTLLGEGLGVVVLKRLTDAVRDGDRVYGLVKTVGQSSDGRALGLLAPRLEGEVLAVQRAYDQAGIDPASITLLEAHGTGVPVGDRTEIQTLRTVMGDRDSDVPRCALGSVKSMISHCIPAAGIAGLIKTTLALYHKVLPPMLCEHLNPELELEKTPFYVNTETRPWIHTPGRPRRAGVNAFGFGGINTHAVLEEYRGAATEPRLAQWTSDIALFAAPDRQALLARLTAVADYIEQRGDSPIRLQDVAWTLANQRQSGDHRLSVVASDLDDLARKLRKAAKALQDLERHSYRTRSGAYFTDQPLDGKLAFVFPGEGAQYHGMMADLAMYFPVVRRWFDFWDSIYEGKRDYPTTSAVFTPPTAMDADVRERVEDRLFSLEVGSESMFISSQAMFTLLQSLGLHADVMLGHSSGENSALVASGTVRIDDQEDLRQYILRLNDMYQDMESAGEIVTGSLLTVGAVSRDVILEVVESSGGELHLALDNCRHQSVLFGPREPMDKAVERFREEGGLCAYLPFDRAYHTPLFEPVARRIEQFFEPVAFGVGTTPLYSCVNAGPYPDQPDQIRHHAVIQWCSRVRFTETVQRLYEDGVRFFIEVGPSGNLSSFIDDILHDKEHVSASANNKNRAGLFQLQKLLGVLFAQGRTVDIEPLFEGRDCCLLDLDRPAPEAPRLAPPLSNTLPYVQLDDADIATLDSILHRPGASDAPVHSQQNPSVQPLVPDVQPVAPITRPEGGGTDFGAGHDSLLTQHFGMMQEFLSQQERVFGAAFGMEVEAELDAGHVPESEDWPFIERLLEQDEDRVVAEFDLDLARHLFLRDHTLYSHEVSDLDPDLCALPVAPMAASLEMLVEAAALLSSQPNLIALENVRAYNWVALDEGAIDGVKTVRIVAERRALDAATERFHAALFDGENVLLEGDVLFSQVASNDASRLPPLVSPRDPVWQDHELYTSGMFHGPLFHSVRRLTGWNEFGIDAELADTPTAGFFGPESNPRFLLNPVLLDAIGHLTAFWIAQSHGTDFSSFPSSIARIDLINPAEQATGGYVGRGRLAFVDSGGQQGRFLEGDYEVEDSQGRAVIRIRGWRDRFFTVPHSFYFARSNPREGWYGENWSTLYPDLSEDLVVWHVPPFPQGFLEDAGALWKRLLVYTVLSREEREVWPTLPANPRRRSEWLMGRIALKEVARYWIASHYGVLLYPADIVIRTDAAGKPYVAGDVLDSAGAMPQVSIAHANGHSVAVARTAEFAVGVDLETFGRIKVPEFIVGAFTDAEARHVQAAPETQREGIALRMWCAKEAAAKSIGMGLNGRPSLFKITEFLEDGCRAVVETEGIEVAVTIREHDGKIIAVANG